MIGMTLEINTYHIQLLLLSVILRNKKYDSADEKKMYEDLEDVLAEMNKLCTAENNYTLAIEVSG